MLGVSSDWFRVAEGWLVGVRLWCGDGDVWGVREVRCTCWLRRLLANKTAGLPDKTADRARSAA